MATNPQGKPVRAKGQEKRSGSGKWIMGCVGLLWLLKQALGRVWFKGTKEVPTLERAPSHASMVLPRRGHETHDANAKWIFAIVVLLFVFGLAIHFILGGFLSALNRTPPPTDRWHPVQRGVRAAPSLPALPRLQISPPAELQKFRAREEAELNSYGWVNKTSGIVHIPIDRAIDLVLQHGLPVRGPTNEIQGGSSTYQLMQQRPERREPEIKGEK